jgi:uncharacterized protein YjbI with pentapeptide repeats
MTGRLIQGRKGLMGKRLIEQLKELFSSLKHFIRQNPLGFLLLLLFLGWMAYTIWITADSDRLGFASNTFWDWMDLLLIPAALAGAGAWFAYVQKRTELEIAEKAREEDRKLAEQTRALDREIALERQQQQTLENFLDRMKELLLDRNLGPEATPEVKRLARTWTLNVLRELPAERNKQVIRFLQESQLLGHEAGVDLIKADLREADLREADLRETDLREADLREADLSKAILHRTNLKEAKLSGINLSEANLTEADLSNADLSGADLSRAFLVSTKLSGANLSETDLSDAVLLEAKLFGGNLTKADLTRADLRKAVVYGTRMIDANLSGATLRGAAMFWDRDIQEQFSQVILSSKTIMPDGSMYPEWKRKQEQGHVQPTDGMQTAEETAAIDEVNERLARPASEDNQELVLSEVKEIVSNSNE